ncbi:MAG TPA: MBL fold metallo-hydrolase [Pyrinomonadaceae bacterium]|nr:MBL fold metallo-hydrolase [Pyrinomonadaceae bacterium]
MANIEFWGGVGTVTGSKYLVSTDKSRVLVDCGLFQGLKELRERNWQDPPFDPHGLDAVLITHAHIDHTGYLPRLVQQGFRGPVYCSRGTADLLKILLPDAGRLQEEEADYRNRHKLTKHKPALPLYTEQNAYDALDLVKPQPNTGETFEPAPGIRASFRVAGHILGSSLVLLELDHGGGDGKGRRVLFSGDLGHYDQPIIQDPVAPPGCDYLLVESTYGDRLHDPEDPKVALARVINDAAQRQAPVLIPAFAVGRTQEIVYLIRELEDEKAIPVLPVTVDSPMAAATTSAYANRKEEHDEEYASILTQKRHPLRTQSMNTASSRQESKRLNDAKGARVIVSASGMMTGGRVLHHALRLVSDPEATIVFVGYQAAGTTGRRILDGEPEVKILGQWVPVRCRTAKIGGFSAHADWSEVLRWLQGMPGGGPRQTFLTHGEPEAATAMAEHIKEKFGWNVHVPQYGERVELV